MAKEIQTDPRRTFPVFILPWLLGLLMLALFWFTLNRWINLLNVGQVAQVSDMVWQPQLFGPLTYLVTLPISWLSTAQIPFALNLTSAILGALSLTILARCVAIMPQDRTEAQRQREKSDFGFLTGWQAYLPPVLAVLLMGLQLTFWQHATSFTGEMVSLLVFAIIFWQLLEYRLDENEWRLLIAAILLGAGIAESWMFVGFFPLFLVAVIWLKKLEFFKAGFLIRMALGGALGLAFIFLLPLVAKFTADFKIGLWESIKPALRNNWLLLKSIKQSDVRTNFALASLSSLLPLLLISFRWSTGFGDSSRIGMALTRLMVHLVHGAIFTVCVWVLFGPAFSAGQLLGGTCLSLNFISALCVGYCCGYFLLVFSRKPAPTRRDPRPAPILPPALMWLCPVIITGTLLASVAAVSVLLYQNRPIVSEMNADTLLKFAQFTTENLPPKGSVLLADSDAPGQDQPLRAILIQSAIARAGRTADYPVLDTQSLNWGPYHRNIQSRYPKVIPRLTPETNDFISPLKTFEMIINLAKSNSICYLNPSYGYYFEQFYQEPRGLLFPMVSYDEKNPLPPPLSAEQITFNEQFWDRVVAALAPLVIKTVTVQDPVEPKNILGKLLLRLHSVPLQNQNAVLVGIFCSRSLNDWAVRLQRAGQLEKAARRFQQALDFNPDNIVAQLNFDFNAQLRAGETIEVNPARVTADAYGKHRNWNAVVTANGPFDDASFCFVAGVQYAQNSLFRQSAIELMRVNQAAPNDIATRVQLAQAFLFGRQSDRALETLREPMQNPARFGLTPDNSALVNLLAASAHFQKDEIPAGTRLLEAEVARHPEDEMLLTAAVQVFMLRGLYTNALHVIDTKLARTPDDVTWLFGKGYASIQIGAFEESIKAMSRVLTIQTNDDSARFNRALAYLRNDQLDKSRADYAQLQSSYTNNYQIAFALGEIAWRKKENAEALRNYRIYVANAPTNTSEFATVRDRIAELGGK